MPEIMLTQGYSALVDEADYAEFNQYKWHAIKRKHTVYARRCVYKKGKQFAIYMHRAILRAPKGSCVDHLNHNGLDNRRDNLRLATWAQNAQNRRRSKGQVSGFKGVSWNSTDEKWQVYIRLNNKNTYLGSYVDRKEAAMAYDAAAKKHYKEFAHTNEEEVT